MVVLSIIFFFLVTFCLGYSISKFSLEPENFLERNLTRIGIGLSGFIVLGLLLNILRIPLDWRIFLALSLIAPLSSLKRLIIKEFPKIKITKYNLSIILMLVIFAVSLYIYAKGAFSYPYLEDDDSWSHAISAKYISEKKTVFRNNAPLHYIDPYPPAFSLLMGVLHQTNNSVYWTLKFFTALIVSLSIIFFYFFVKELTGDYNKALFSTFALASIPAFLSHFIWSIALAVPMYFVSFYCLERIKHDKKWLIPSSIAIAATLTISPTHSTYFGIFFALYYITKVILEKKLLLHYAISGFLGALLSLILWWGPMVLRYGLYGMLKGIGLALGAGESIISVGGTIEKYYTLNDFLFAKSVNMINNPIGIGIFLSLLTIISLIIILIKNRIEKKFSALFFILIIIPIAIPIGLFQLFIQKNQLSFFQFLIEHGFMVSGLILTSLALILSIFSYLKSKQGEEWRIIALVWLTIMFYSVNSAKFLVKISAFRTWMLFAIPLCILSAEGMWFLMGIANKFRVSRALLLAIVIIGIIFTSGYQKYSVNTAQWPPGAFWTSYEEINGYVWLKNNIEHNAKIFTFVNHGAIIGMDKYICRWCEDDKKFQEQGFNENPEGMSSWLRKKNYEFLVIDGNTVKKFGINQTNSKLQGLVASGYFQLAYQNPSFFLFRVV